MEGGEPKFFAVTDNTVQNVSRGKVGIRGLQWHNDDNAVRYLQIFDAVAGDVTLGTTVANHVIQLGADRAEWFDFGDAVFQTAFSFAVTTTRNGNTGGSLNDVMVVVR